MSGFFSANVTSPFPDQNALYDASKVAQAGQTYQSNQLHMQGQQIDLSNANMAQVGQAAAGLLSAYPDEASRAAAYPRVVGMLQAQGFAKNAPPTYPGEGVLRSLVNQSIPAKDLYSSGALLTPAQQQLLGQGNTGTAPTTGATAQPATGGTASGVATAPSGQTIEPAAFNNATAVRDGLIKRGIDPDTATALAANALHESVANPATGRGDNGNSAGLFQWGGPRLQAYTDAYGHSPDGSPLDEQLDNVVRELKGSEAPAAAKIAEAQGPAAKAAAVSQYYLRPKDTQAEMQRRSATALQLQQQIGGGATTATAAPARGGATPGSYQVASTAPVPPPGSTAAPDAQWDLPGAPAPDQPSPPAAAAAAPAQTGQPSAQAAQPPAAPAAAPASTSRLPDASTIPTGRNSAAWQQAQQLIDQGNRLMIVSGSNAGMRAQAQAMIQRGTQQQQLDNMVPAQQDGRPGNLNTTTGAFTPYAPLPSPRGMQNTAAAWDGTKWVPVTPDNQANAVQGTWAVTGSGAQFYPNSPAGIQRQEEAKTSGAATGTQTAQVLPALISQARAAAKNEGDIDYASNQIAQAAKGNIPTGYFSGALATAAAVAKSLGIDTTKLGVDPAAVGNIQSAQKTLAVLGGAILQQAIGKGNPITDAKIEAFEHTQPGIETDPQALQRIMAWARSQYTYEREMGQAAVAEAAKPENNGILPPSWVPRYYHQTGFAPVYDPIGGEMRQPDGSQPARETPPPQASAPQEGATATGPNGHKIVLRGGQWVPQ